MCPGSVFGGPAHRLAAPQEERTPPRGGSRWSPLWALAFVAVLGAGCSSDGVLPPVGRLNYPIALGLSPLLGADGPSHLIVANANFDLRYRAGTVQAYDLAAMNRLLDERCRPGGVRIPGCGISPVQDERDDLTPEISTAEGVLVSEVVVGSFVDGMAVLNNGDGRARVYLPIRSNGDLAHIDLDAGGQLSCGDDASSTALTSAQRHECTDAFARSLDGPAAERDLFVPSDPVAISARPLAELGGGPGNYILMAHRGGRVSLFFDDTATAPRLIHVLYGLPAELIDITVDPATGSVWLPTSLDPVIPRAQVAFDGATSIDSFVYRLSDLGFAGTDTGDASIGDTRAVRFDPRPGVRRAYVLARRPRALLTVDLEDTVGSLAVRGVAPVGSGPSRLEIATFAPSAPAEPERALAFVSCFDSGDLYVIDLDSGLLTGIVRGLGGPFELEVDVTRRRLYVLDFTSSVIRVLDLQPMFNCLGDTDYVPDDPERECSPSQIGFVGRPRAVRELI